MTDPAPSIRPRCFPAFSPVKGTGRRFATSYWGNAWIDALEAAALDEEELKVARRYARKGQVGAITVSSGRISALVSDGDPDDQRHATVRLPTHDDRTWDRLDRQLLTAGHLAALVDGQLPQDLVEDSATIGAPILPALGELDPECDCDEPEHPCRHAGALAYQFGWLLDADPFLIFLLRGRDRRALLESLQLLAATPAPDDLGPTVAEIYRLDPAPLPDLTALLAEPRPTSTAARAVASAAGTALVDPKALSLLLRDVRGRSERLLQGDRTGSGGGVLVGTGTTDWQDAVRMVAGLPGPAAREAVARATGHSITTVQRAAAAWSSAGPDGLTVLESPWTPPPAADRLLREALARLPDSGPEDGPTVRAWRNRWTLGPGAGQVRYGQDRRWYAYRRRLDAWWPAGEPSATPDIAVAIALGALPAE
jgi:uncharacterized Zn finger protein